MNKEKIEATLSRIDMATFGIPSTAKLFEDCDGKLRVSVALRAADVNDPAKEGPKDGFWPPHSVELAADDETTVFATHREATLRALAHEVDEHRRVDGAILSNPHA